jgi:hypothetical protein
MASNFYRKFSRNIGNAATTIGDTAGSTAGGYVVAASTQTTVIGLSVANIAAAAITASVYHWDGATATYLVKNGAIPIGSSLIVVGGDQKLVMQTGDSIRIITNTAAPAADALMSLLEITP